MPTIAGSTRAARLSTFETITDRTPAVDERRRARLTPGSPRTGRRGPGRRATASRRHRERASRRAEARRRRLHEPKRAPEPPFGEVRGDHVVGREARHQRLGDLAAECAGESPRLPQLDLEEAPPVDRLRDGLDATAEPRRHATGEDDHRDRTRAKRLRPRLRRPRRSPALPGPAATVRSSGLRGLDRPLDDVRPGRQRPGHELRPKPVERGGVERRAARAPRASPDRPRRGSSRPHRNRQRDVVRSAMNPLLGHDRRDQLGRRDVEGGIARREARRHLGAVALLDRNRRAVGASRDRSSRSERRSRTGIPWWRASTARP